MVEVRLDECSTVHSNSYTIFYELRVRSSIIWTINQVLNWLIKVGEMDTKCTNFMVLSFSSEAASSAATKNLPIFYGTWSFITIFTRLYWSLFWATSIRSIPSHSISLKSTCIIAYHLRVGPFSSSFTTNILHSSPPRSHCMPFSSHTLWLGHPNYTWLRAHHYAVSSNLLVFLLSLNQVFPSALCSTRERYRLIDRRGRRSSADFYR